MRLIFILFFTASASLAQDDSLHTPLDSIVPADSVVFQLIEQMPEFPGRESAMYSFLARNTNYPAIARESGIQGKVYVEFIVEKDGALSDIQVVKGIGGGCDREAIRVVKRMPRWKPGKQRGKVVRCRFRLPFNFVLK